LAVIIIAAVVIIDQVSKIWIKTNFHLGESIDVASWFKIYFIENPGMAFGMNFGGEFGKLFLSLFRIALVTVISVQLYKLTRKATPTGVFVGLALIIAGAAGNIFDSMLYGILFNESTAFQVATFMPEDGGYASFLHGKVVDMLYFPIIDTTLPSWIPFIGGNDFVFFRPIFNIADASITTGILYLLIFQRKFFLTRRNKVETIEAENSEITTDTDITCD